MQLDTAESRYGKAVVTEPHAPVAAWASVLYPNPNQLLWQAAPGGLGKPEVYAYVNHSRWVVDCPFCNSAQLAAESDHRFFCAGPDGCGNSAAGGKFLPVIWPKEAEKIEEILLERLEPTTRNWRPGETLETLMGEVPV